MEWPIIVKHNVCWGVCNSVHQVLVKKRERFLFSEQCYTRCDHQLKVSADVIIH